MDHPDDLEHDDPDLAAALRRRAEDLTGPIDTDTALADMHAQARKRRTWRLGTGAVLGAAAAAILVLAGMLTLTGGDRAVLRTPATQPDTAVGPSSTEVPTAPPASAAPATATTIPAAPTTTPTAPGSASTVTGPAPMATTMRPEASTAPPATASPTTTATTPTTTTASASPTSTYPYTSVGGSIVVRLRDGRIALDGTPAPTAGWSVRIDDDGPDRVRIRFELEDRRSEIRVDLDNGQPVAEITET